MSCATAYLVLGRDCVEPASSPRKPRSASPKSVSFGVERW